MKIWKGDNIIEKDTIYTLGLESSCDETAAAIVASDGRILSNIVRSHCMQDYGGVVPEFAARAHIDCMPSVLAEALSVANLTLKDIDLIGYTNGPGLIGGLIVSNVFGKMLASTLRLPSVAVNHLEGHILSVLLEHDIAFPFLAVLLTGGHSQLIDVRGIDDYTILGGTVDDAVGELFDKVARMLGMQYPGGPHIERCALLGDPSVMPLPRPMSQEQGCYFSCSGLKTAVRQLLDEIGPERTAQDTADICASMQQSITAVLTKKIGNALKTTRAGAIALVGGVAANRYIRNSIVHSFPEHQVFNPSPSLCSDNGAMIAFAAYKRFQRGYYSDICAVPEPNLSLEERSV